MIKPGPSACVAAYAEQLDEDAQVDLKGEAKAFVRTHGFLATIIAYTELGWAVVDLSELFSFRNCHDLLAAAVGTTVLGLSGQFPVNSRFGEINSRLSAQKFPVCGPIISSMLLI
jgi:hypothetical protein